MTQCRTTVSGLIMGWTFGQEWAWGGRATRSVHQFLDSNKRFFIFCSATENRTLAVHWENASSIVPVLPFCLSPSLKVFVFIRLYRLWLLSLADTNPLVYPAFLTHDVAAPVELAVAAFASCLLQDVVSSPTTQALAVVHALACLVADATLRPGRVWLDVLFAEIWWLLEVDKLIGVVAPPLVLLEMVVVVVLMIVMMVVMTMVVVLVLMMGYMLHLACVAVMCFDQCS